LDCRSNPPLACNLALDDGCKLNYQDILDNASVSVMTGFSIGLQYHFFWLDTNLGLKRCRAFRPWPIKVVLYEDAPVLNI
jgi:uncharacterized protein YcfL